ncbi:MULTISPECIES: alternate-type signal peptide domain-containing protein [Rhodococcus]|jgi:alternate signal-mediated exported protein|uniref:Alternate-type signal peptide domain-containing protein n=1 Tax=Rhodococcus cerastii TaxID=908616 RepID=A0ABU4D5D6_9NOCA|nr:MULTISPECIES: alternate-type signal peptide domain-containing protein [Rhodococcus]MDV6304948.1 alternate-type signal peptide domain-containing protein [Rhodococcus cerastii]MDV7989380.1 alternate-type signal peptide domain-containing protein [Rhodococcus sp. IEGM 1374]OZE30441.1 hypothetical protein CH256_14630 [Rhodococcus sp. 05-2254-6]OZE32890.1 hypothetical protein CH259_20820 [Rhodococcus sp. 05-2254-4]OZE44216.1 hypothetical protein CH261_17835 [Rhodococcus sp. 05-2254-3]
MNKATKGAIAAGAAAVLLLGGLGSYALWQDTETVTGGEINSGELYFDPVANTANWTETTSGTVIGTDPSGFLIVPGDVLEYTTDYNVTWAGNNLLASITADFADVTGDAELEAALAGATVSVNGGPNVPNGDPVSLPLGATSPTLITVAVTIPFDIDTGGLIAQDESVSLADITLTLDQVRP